MWNKILQIANISKGKFDIHSVKWINPLSPNSDQHQISPFNINGYSIPEVRRNKDMIT